MVGIRYVETPKSNVYQFPGIVQGVRTRQLYTSKGARSSAFRSVRTLGYKTVVKSVPRAQGEMKQKHALLSTTAPFISMATGTAQYYDLTDITSGADKDERVGNLVHLKYVELRGLMSSAAIATATIPGADPNSFVRVTVAHCAVPLGTLPLATLATSLPLTKVLFPELLKTHYDQVHYIKADLDLLPSTDVAQITPRFKPVHIKLEFPGKGIPIRYASNVSNTASTSVFVKVQSTFAAAPIPSFVQGFIKFGWADS